MDAAKGVLPGAWHQTVAGLQSVIAIARQLGLQGAIFQGSGQNHQERIDYADDNIPPLRVEREGLSSAEGDRRFGITAAVDAHLGRGLRRRWA